MTTSQGANLIGRIAIHYKLVTEAQLMEAVRSQGRFGNDKRIGEILLELGFISHEQLEWLLQAQAQIVAKQREVQVAAQREAQAAHEAATHGGRSIDLAP